MTARLVGAFVLGLLAVAALVAVPALAVVAGHGFDGLYGQDAFAYVDYALGPLRSAIAEGRLPPPFYWPPGYPLLIVVASWAGSAPSLAQAVSLGAGAVVPAATALLAWQLETGVGPGRGVEASASRPERRVAIALLAGGIVAAAGQLLQSSVVAMADTTGAALAVLGTFAIARYDATNRRRWLAAGAAALAFATTVRWVYALVMIALGAAALSAIVRKARPNPARALGDAAVGFLAGGLAAAPTAIPMLAALAAGTPLPFAADFAAYHWDVANVFRRSIETIDGRLGYDLPTGIYYLTSPLRRGWLWLIAPLALPGLLSIGRRPRVPEVAILLVWPALVVGFLVGGGYQNARFFLAALPPLAILAARGVAVIWTAAARLFADGRSGDRLRTRVVRGALAGVVATMLAANLGWGIEYTRGFVARQAADLEAIRGLAAMVPDGARILTLGASPVLRHDGHPGLIELYWLDAASARALVADGHVSFVLVDVASMSTQWAGRGAGRAFAALAADPGLDAVATLGTWTLLRARSPT